MCPNMVSTRRKLIVVCIASIIDNRYCVRKRSLCDYHYTEAKYIYTLICKSNVSLIISNRECCIIGKQKKKTFSRVKNY